MMRQHRYMVSSTRVTKGRRVRAKGFVKPPTKGGGSQERKKEEWKQVR